MKYECEVASRGITNVIVYPLQSLVASQWECIEKVFKQPKKLKRAVFQGTE